MKQEALEMVFFDLLEGNLSKEESAKWLKKIEADAQLKMEWEAWQNAILPADAIVFEEKELLYKIPQKSRKIIPFYWYAAAAVLVPAPFEHGFLIIGEAASH